MQALKRATQIFQQDTSNTHTPRAGCVNCSTASSGIHFPPFSHFPFSQLPRSLFISSFRLLSSFGLCTLLGCVVLSCGVSVSSFVFFRSFPHFCSLLLALPFVFRSHTWLAAQIPAQRQRQRQRRSWLHPRLPVARRLLRDLHSSSVSAWARVGKPRRVCVSTLQRAKVQLSRATAASQGSLVSCSLSLSLSLSWSHRRLARTKIILCFI